jgi:hypothetical protein
MQFCFGEAKRRSSFFTERISIGINGWFNRSTVPQEEADIFSNCSSDLKDQRRFELDQLFTPLYGHYRLKRSLSRRPESGECWKNIVSILQAI